MKKIIFILLFLVTQVNADSGTSNVIWNNNIIECGTSLSHGVTHFGVPNLNAASIAAIGTRLCTTHSYYSSGDYNKSFTLNGGIDGCPSGERAVAWNFSARTITCRKFDDTTPTISDLPDSSPSVSPANGSNLLASNSQTFTITPSTNSGAPIVKIQGYFEDSASCTNGFHPIITSNTSSISTIPTTHNIKEVKPGCDFNAGGYREYSFKITYFEDEAGNYLGTLNAPSTNAGLKTYTYNVFANTIVANTYDKRIVTTEEVTNVNNVADGMQKNVIVTLKDLYQNPIIKATSIGRKINFIFDVNNNLFLDQLNNSGGSAVYMSIPSDSSNFLNNRFAGNGSQIKTFTDQISSDGTYTFGFKVFAPTKYLNTINDFTINSIKFSIVPTTTISVGDNPSNELVSNSTNKIFNFKPIFETNITGEIVTDGFVEGKTQSGSIDINKNTTTVNPLNQGIYFVQTGSGSANSYFTSTGYIDSYKTILKTGIGTQFISHPFNTGINYLFYTLFTLKDGLGYINDIKDIRLKEYITYKFPTIPAVQYLAKTLNDSNTQNFETLKIYGNTNIDKNKQKDLVSNQDTNDIQNLNGEITKSQLKQEIRKNAINTIKYVDIIGGTNITDLTGINWNNTGGNNLGNILYFGGLNGANVTLNNGNHNSSSSYKFNGRKTIIIYGGNLYINSNIINATNDDILGIIVLKDDNGKGGQVYIDTSVQEVDAVIFTDKSVISYDTAYDNGDTNTISKHEIDGKVNNTGIANQLYIYGTVFSENNIGGSRLNTPTCPFYTQSISGLVCDTIRSQRYDFNYLRSGFNNKYNASYPNYPIVIKYNSTIQTTPPPLFTN